MSKSKTGLWILAGVLAGIVVLRAIREQRRTPRDEAKAAVDDAIEEAGAATEHATAAAGHARVAGQKAIEHARQEFEKPKAKVDGDKPRPTLRTAKQRLRRR